MNNRIIKLAAMWAMFLCMSLPGFVSAQSGFTKTRLIIMADMGNEHDEMQQMMHMLMYNNMFDLEGLLAVTGKHRDWTVTPELFTELIDAYAEVLPSLEKHADGWHSVSYLHSITKGGIKEYGIGGIGTGKNSPASDLILASLIKDDDRPVYLVANAGTSELGQALHDLSQTKSQEEMDKISEKIIVYENGSQDDGGAWITMRYPEVRWHRSNNQTYMYASWGGPYTWEDYARTSKGQHDWAEEHIQTNHGALGDKYPDRTNIVSGDKNDYWPLEGGGTSPWTGLSNHGLFDPDHMYWGGWGGRFSRTRHSTADNELAWSKYPDIRSSEEKQAQDLGKDLELFLADTEEETWTDPVHNDTYSDFKTPIYRWRRAMFNDFRARMDWCVNDFAGANHNPVAAVNADTADTIIIKYVKPGTALDLDASATRDPDGDELDFKWWIYKEAGTYTGDVDIAKPFSKAIQLEVPADAEEKEFHVILEVKDKNNPNSEISMYDYRRVVIYPRFDLLSTARKDGGIKWTVTYQNGALVFGNIGPGAHKALIYNSDGRLVHESMVLGGRAAADNLNKGVYLVKAGSARLRKIVVH